MKSKFIVRDNNSFVVKVRQYKQKGRQKIAFETSLEAFRLEAKTAKRTIQIQDFGAGSKKLGNERTIASIYKTSVASIDFQRMMFHIIQDFDFKNILEMGTSLGFSSVYLSKATSGKVTTIEACPNTSAEAHVLFKRMELTNIQLINATFQDYFKENANEKFDFVYIDGHHDGKALLEYVELLKIRITDNALLLVDDIRWSKGMKSAWDKLIADPFFHAKADLFRMGVLSVGD